MLDTSPENLRGEIELATKFMEKHTSGVRRLVRRYMGGFYRGRGGLDTNITENVGYELVSRVVPKLVYKNPRFIVSADNPLDGPPGGTMNDVAMGLSAYLNRWSADNQFENPLAEVAYDFLFGFGVLLTYLGDYPGRQAFENVTPRRPCATRVDPALFVIDPLAKSQNVFSHDGPRFMGHMWRADLKDIQDDDSFDQKQVSEMATDTDLEEYNPNNDDAGDTKREQVYAWDIWVPEDQRGNDAQYNGSWHTVCIKAAGNKATKKTYELRKPRAAHCPAWGPYTVFGAFRVPDSPIPMSPLVATAESAEEVNAHAVKTARDAASYKRFAVGNKERASDAQTVKTIRHGQMALMEDTDSVTEMTIGGAQPEQYNYLAVARERLNRLLGLSNAMRNTPDPNVTATAENIAASASNVIIDGFQKSFRASVEQVARSVAFYAFYNDSVRQNITGPNNKPMVFQGGLAEGQEEFNFYDLSIRVEPYSLEHSDQTVLQRRFMDTFNMVATASTAMAQAPYVNWSGLLNPVLDTLNAGSIEDVVNTQLLNQMAGIQAVTQAQRNMGSNKALQGRSAGGSSRGTPTSETAAELAGNALY